MENRCFDFVNYQDSSFPESYQPDQHTVALTEKEAENLLKESCPTLFEQHHRAQLRRAQSRVEPNKLFFGKSSNLYVSPMGHKHKQKKVKKSSMTSLYSPVKKSKSYGSSGGDKSKHKNTKFSKKSTDPFSHLQPFKSFYQKTLPKEIPSAPYPPSSSLHTKTNTNSPIFTSDEIPPLPTTEVDFFSINADSDSPVLGLSYDEAVHAGELPTITGGPLNEKETEIMASLFDPIGKKIKKE